MVVRGAQQRGLGDLEAQMAGHQVGISQRLFDGAEETLLHELSRGHVDGDAIESAVRESPLPRRECLARLPKHPGAERLDEAELLGHRNERGRRHGFPVACPAHERLEADARAGVQRHDWLVVHLERHCILTACRRSLSRPIRSIACACMCGVEHLVPRLAPGLGVIHRGVGVAHDLFGTVVAEVAECDADARGREDFAAADRERRAERVLDPERDGVGLRFVPKLVEEDREFVTTEPRERIPVAQAPFQPARHRR